jgi:nitrogen regulatory protein P-II 1
MKRIEAIVRPGKVGDVCAALELAGHHGVMITEIEGHGNQKGIEQKVHGKSYKISLLTKAIAAAAYTGKIGDGKIFIHPVDDAVRIRTAERGDIAIG